jgi:glycoprotein-N-acetylgalactosamine 3-beta-galactosyltransferase
MTYTISSRHTDQVRGITETWARRCDGYLAMSNATDPSVPSVALTHDGPESYFNMWQKVRALWQHVAASPQLLLQRYDFFFLGGDDVYLIPDNLRRLLRRLDASPDDAWYLGRRLADADQPGAFYHSGGAGYVLSRGAVRRLVEDGLQSSFCRPHDAVLWEDVNVGHCLAYLGVVALDTADEAGRQVFHFQTPEFLVEQGRKEEIGRETVSFHYVRSRREMRVLDALVYGSECEASSSG